MKYLLFFLLLCLMSCTEKVTPQAFKYVSPKPTQRTTIYTIRSGAYEDPTVWNLGVVPEPYDVADVNDSISISTIRQLKGLKSTRGGKLYCLPGGSLSISPKY
ncbi:hypothetical protein LV89_01968 [Arcicella aurantiaca]|uniref:Uncharacterized protein n=1 Tax=Arcicella aurantiaca TaxID=591202 RepID=A0A316E8R6_9BACT|nr:hypothetical protein [Arcicella aurantiaca]PWK27153.1 hypothetical protein LV89_01968 [Arcicella aurantiaca]